MGVIDNMAKNPPPGKGRKGAVKNRKQVYNPKIGRWTKFDNKTKKFISQMGRKHKVFKGVIKHK